MLQILLSWNLALLNAFLFFDRMDIPLSNALQHDASGSLEQRKTTSVSGPRTSSVEW